jgi:hypothetical protein
MLAKNEQPTNVSKLLSMKLSGIKIRERVLK